MLKKLAIIGSITILVVFIFSEASSMDEKLYNELSPKEERIIIHKETEPPFSGKYNDFFEKGSYHCKRCDTPLYLSKDKFASGSGWPSFDDNIQKAIEQKKDADGVRTEIVCANCGAHLGHVFQGENKTDNNVRHCVNSLSLVFVPDQSDIKQAFFAGGCFWGIEHLFEHKKGVVSAVSGFMGGKTRNPSYQDVVYKNTGHFEVVKVIYDPDEINYEELAKFFFEIHDPTQTNGQGPDIGSQYLSAVFYENNDEKEIINKLIGILNKKGYKVATKIIPISKFFEAEKYHQDYYDKNKQKPYCHTYKKKF